MKLKKLNSFVEPTQVAPKERVPTEVEFREELKFIHEEFATLRRDIFWLNNRERLVNLKGNPENCAAFKKHVQSLANMLNCIGEMAGGWA